MPVSNFLHQLMPKTLTRIVGLPAPLHSHIWAKDANKPECYNVIVCLFLSPPPPNCAHVEYSLTGHS